MASFFNDHFFKQFRFFLQLRIFIVPYHKIISRSKPVNKVNTFYCEIQKNKMEFNKVAKIEDFKFFLKPITL